MLAGNPCSLMVTLARGEDGRVQIEVPLADLARHAADNARMRPHGAEDHSVRALMRPATPVPPALLPFVRWREEYADALDRMWSVIERVCKTHFPAAAAEPGKLATVDLAALRRAFQRYANRKSGTRFRSSRWRCRSDDWAYDD